jgi:hypothetical protein
MEEVQYRGSLDDGVLCEASGGSSSRSASPLTTTKLGSDPELLGSRPMANW